MRLPALLSTSLTVPGSDSARANVVLVRDFHENIEGTFSVVVPFRRATPAQIGDLERRVAAAARVVPTARVTQERAILGLLYVNLQTSMPLNHASTHTDALRRALRAEGVPGALVTGPPALEADLTPILNSDLHRGEVLAVALALALLVAVLGLCWALLIPFVVAAGSVAAALVIVYLLAQRFLMVLYIPNIVALIGLGLAIDYSLLIVHRLRQEIREGGGGDVGEAIVRTMSSAGRTVVFSGLAVGIGLATLLLVPVPFVRSLGAAGLTVPVVALGAALTLQPALLSLIGRRGVSPVGFRGLLAGRDILGGAWARIARPVLRRPVLVLVASALALSALGASVFWLQLTPGSLTAIPQQVESARALQLVSARVGSAVITPIEIVIDAGASKRVDSPAYAAKRLLLAKAVLADPGVFAVAVDNKPPFVDGTGRFARILVVSHRYYGDETTQRLVHRLRDRVIPSVRFPSGTTVLVGGAAAQGVDFLSAVYGTLPWIVLLALSLAYLVLVRAFRSLLLALVAVLLDLLSVGVTYGLLVVVFRFGVGSALLGTYHVSQIEGWVPIFVFAVLFGLSSDYEVFIVTRMRESWDRGAGTRQAITDGLAHTGGVVTAAAVILVGALSGLVFGHIAGLQELGVGLALGVLIDATVIRGLVLPSVMALMGRWNWWLPAPVARVLMTKASPLAARGGRP